MIEGVKTLLEAICKDMGYIVLDWGDSETGFYTPFCQKTKNGKEGVFIGVNIHSDGGIYIHDFTGDSDKLYVGADGVKELLGDMDYTPEAVKDFEGKKQELFTSIYKQLKIEAPRKEHELFQSKNLLPYGGYVVESPISYKVGNKQYEFTIKDNVVVPFYDSFDSPCVGIQLRASDLSKQSIKFSKFKQAFHVLQDGKFDKYLGNTLGYITESFTTAIEIAEAMPSAFVACTAGISQQLDVYRYIRDAKPEIFLIAVLDKTEDGFPSKEETKLKQRTKYIQLDLFDNKNNGITDYNEYALRYGKGAVKKEVYKATMEIYPKLPEVLSYSDGEFKIVSAIHGGIETVRFDKVKDKVLQVMNLEAIKIFAKKMGVDIESE